MEKYRGCMEDIPQPYTRGRYHHGDMDPATLLLAFGELSPEEARKLSLATSGKIHERRAALEAALNYLNEQENES